MVRPSKFSVSVAGFCAHAMAAANSDTTSTRGRTPHNDNSGVADTIVVDTVPDNINDER
jgi:hypothetical protein